MPVLQQKNSTDCGIYVIAFAYFIVNNTDPSIVSLDKSKLRKHLYFLFQNCKITPFPLSSRKERKNKEKTIFLNLFCNCRMSWSNFDGGHFDMQMVIYDVCLEWFHRKCERIPDITFSPNVIWECHQCKLISWINMTIVLLGKVLIGKTFIVIAKFTQEVKGFVVT